jgi:hypothetical protein
MFRREGGGAEMRGRSGVLSACALLAGVAAARGEAGDAIPCGSAAVMPLVHKVMRARGVTFVKDAQHGDACGILVREPHGGTTVLTYLGWELPHGHVKLTYYFGDDLESKLTR